MPRPDRATTDHDSGPDPALSPDLGAPDTTAVPGPTQRSRPTRAVAAFRPYPTSPARTRRSPATTAGAGRARPGASATPATVWFTSPTPDTAAAASTPARRRGDGGQAGVVAGVLRSFSSDGAPVMVLAWPDRDGRPTDADPTRPGPPRPGLDTMVATALRLGRFPIVTPTGPRSAPVPHAGDTPPAAGPVPREATLLITAMPSDVTASTAAADEVARRAAAALPIGGILAVLTHCDWENGVLRDPTGPMVTAAQNADLLYLQHIIAIHLPARDLRLHHPLDRRPAAVRPARRVHSDVLVFAQPQHRQDPPSPTDPAGLVQTGPGEPLVEGRP